MDKSQVALVDLGTPSLIDVLSAYRGAFSLAMNGQRDEANARKSEADDLAFAYVIGPFVSIVQEGLPR